MNRPYTVCHMSSSLNGKIHGPWMGVDEAHPLHEAYEKTNGSYQPDAWTGGRVTTEGAFTNHHKPELEANSEKYSREDYVAVSDSDMYYVSIDTSGRVGWQSNTVQYQDRAPAHVIEILSNKVSDEYIAYLRKYNISYIFAGEDKLDGKLALEKLYNLFGIKTLMISGGGYSNYSFLNEDLIDEISITMAPIVEGETNKNTSFEKADYLPEHSPVAFDLKDVDKLAGGVLWIRYTRKNN